MQTTDTKHFEIKIYSRKRTYLDHYFVFYVSYVRNTFYSFRRELLLNVLSFNSFYSSKVVILCLFFTGSVLELLVPVPPSQSHSQDLYSLP